MREMGFKKGRIVETIVTTYNRDGSPNAAPMGVYAWRRRILVLKVHSRSDTCANILRTGGCVVNLVYDPFLFIRSALAPKGEPEVKEEETGKAETVYAPFLRESHAYLEAGVLGFSRYTKRDAHGTSQVYVVKCRVQRRVVLRSCPVGLNRGIAAAIEIAIKLSRGRKDGVEEHMRVMRRTLNAAEYSEIASFLDQHL